MDREWQKFVKIQEVPVSHHWDVEDESEFVCSWRVKVGDLNLEEV
jgi:hypothetical protein